MVAHMPAGRISVGDFLPAGKYSFQYEGANSCYMYVYEDMETEISKLSDCMGNDETKVIELAEGESLMCTGMYSLTVIN